MMNESIPICIKDEFSELQSVILAHPDSLTCPLEEDLLPYEEIGQSRAQLKAILISHGITVHHQAATQSASIFARDPYFCIDDTLYISKMRQSRAQESHLIDDIRQRFSRCVELQHGRIEGGDVMVLKNGVVLVGIHHTTIEGANELQEDLRRTGREVIPILHSGIHLDCVLSPFPQTSTCPSSVITDSKTILPDGKNMLKKIFGETIYVDYDHWWNTSAPLNIQWLNPQTIMHTINSEALNQPGMFQPFMQQIRKRGIQMIRGLDDIVPFKLHGGVRCSMCPLERKYG